MREEKETKHNNLYWFNSRWIYIQSYPK